jgi:hypothetical protein
VTTPVSPDDNSWNVTIKKHSSGHGKTFQVKERDLLGGESIVKHAYNEMCANKKQKVLAKNKRMRQKEARAKESKLADVARKGRKVLEKEEYNKILAIFASGHTYEWTNVSTMIDPMQKKLFLLYRWLGCDHDRG